MRRFCRQILRLSASWRRSVATPNISRLGLASGIGLGTYSFASPVTRVECKLFTSMPSPDAPLGEKIQWLFDQHETVCTNQVHTPACIAHHGKKIVKESFNSDPSWVVPAIVAFERSMQFNPAAVVEEYVNNSAGDSESLSSALLSQIPRLADLKLGSACGMIEYEGVLPPGYTDIWSREYVEKTASYLVTRAKEIMSKKNTDRIVIAEVGAGDMALSLLLGAQVRELAPELSEKIHFNVSDIFQPQKNPAFTGSSSVDYSPTSPSRSLAAYLPKSSATPLASPNHKGRTAYDSISFLSSEAAKVALDQELSVSVTNSGYMKALDTSNPDIVIVAWMPAAVDWSRKIRSVASVDEYILIGKHTANISTGHICHTWGKCKADEKFGNSKISLEPKELVEVVARRPQPDAPYIKDGFKRFNLHSLTDLQITRLETPLAWAAMNKVSVLYFWSPETRSAVQKFEGSQTVSFRRVEETDDNGTNLKKKE